MFKITEIKCRKHGSLAYHFYKKMKSAKEQGGLNYLSRIGFYTLEFCEVNFMKLY